MPAPCPYISGQVERKVFTHLINNDARELHNTLSQSGFRRSQNIAYRPACDGCKACISVRVPVDAFRWTRGFRRSLARNTDLVATAVPAKATPEQFSLFRDYITERHDDGGMAEMTALDFSAMIDESYVDTRIIEYRLSNPVSLADPAPALGELAAAAITDVLEDGLSMIYSFYDSALQGRSLGTYMILEHIERAKQLSLPYLYLGYWIAGSAKMDYKAKFLPQERLADNGWKLCNE